MKAGAICYPGEGKRQRRPRVWGLCGHSKGPRSSFISRAAKPHSSARALRRRGLGDQPGSCREPGALRCPLGGRNCGVEKPQVQAPEESLPSGRPQSSRCCPAKVAVSPVWLFRLKPNTKKINPTVQPSTIVMLDSYMWLINTAWICQ